jgi:hypothetical protein
MTQCSLVGHIPYFKNSDRGIKHICGMMTGMKKHICSKKNLLTDKQNKNA